MSRYTSYDPNFPAKNLKGRAMEWYLLKPGAECVLLPIPQDELNANSALTKADQNPGYLTFLFRYNKNSKLLLGVFLCLLTSF